VPENNPKKKRKKQGKKRDKTIKKLTQTERVATRRICTTIRIFRVLGFRV
jgi:hypothetical protein